MVLLSSILALSCCTLSVLRFGPQEALFPTPLVVDVLLALVVPGPVLDVNVTLSPLVLLFQLKVLMCLSISHPGLAAPPLVKSEVFHGVRTDNHRSSLSGL